MTQGGETAAPATAKIKPVLIGGELIGRKREEGHDGGYFEPLVTDAVEGQRYVLLPRKQYVTVLSYVTGQRLGILALEVINNVEDGDKITGTEPVFVQCAALSCTPKAKQQSLSSAMNENKAQSETISAQSLFVGCSNGCLLEFWIADLLLLRPSASRRYDMGDYSIPGPVYYPRRSIQLAIPDSQPIMFLTFPEQDSVKNTVGYALVRTDTDKDEVGVTTTSSKFSLIRLIIPHSTETTANTENTSIQVKSTIIACLERSKRMAGDGDSKTNLKIVGLLSCPCGGQQEGKFMVIVALDQQVRLFYDKLKKKNAFSYVSFLSPEDPLTVIALSPNKSSVACGHSSGRIYILNDFVRLYQEFMVSLQRFVFGQSGKPDGRAVATNKPKAPFILRRKLHWHALPVTALSFESNSVAEEPFLYSGGMESVLCGWQLARGEDKPAVLLPRIGMGAISHLCHVDVASSNNSQASILVHCIDGTLQTFNTQNLKVKWKVSSIPASDSCEDGSSSFQMRVVRSPMRNGSLPAAIFGSPEVAGFIHWQDPEAYWVNHSLEVAPFNRVSRTEVEDEELPPPMVIHAAFNDTGRTLMTLDVVSTEVSSYGAPKTHSDGSPFGSVTSLKFWEATGYGVTPEDYAYHVVAELSSPHGKTNTVGAAALSRTGDLACTVSPEENAFRIWQRRTKVSLGEAQNEGIASWFCRYRITVPSGFSNHSTKPRAVSFSADESTLAIGFGNFVTLWDVDEQVLLASLPHANDDMEAIVDRISFLPSGSLLCDMMMTCSQERIAVQSPFGHCGARNLGWCWSLADEEDDFDGKTIISCAEYIEPNECVAVALYNPGKRKSTVLLLDVETGKPNAINNSLELPGKITDIGSLQTHPKPTSSWDGPSRAPAEIPFDLIFALEGGRCFRCTWGAREVVVRPSKRQDTQPPVPATPSIPFLSDHMFNSRKRAVEAFSYTDLVSVSRKKLSVDHFGKLDGEPLGDEELPVLHGTFAKAFLARHLFKREQAE